MTNVAVTDIAMASLTLGQPAAGAQPGAQQVARFEQRLQTPGAGEAQYQAPVMETAGTGGNWQAVMGDVGKLAEQYRVDNGSLDADALTADFPADSQASGPSAALVQTMTKVTHMSYTMMNVSFVTSTEHMMGENVRSLFQLS